MPVITGGEQIPVQGGFSPAVTERSLLWMRQQQEAGKPFFIVMAYNVPHGGATTEPAVIQLFRTDRFPEPASLYDAIGG